MTCLLVHHLQMQPLKMVFSPVSLHQEQRSSTILPRKSELSSGQTQLLSDGSFFFSSQLLANQKQMFRIHSN